MLFRKQQWDGLADGSITVAFRRWKRPTVKAGGTLRSPVGLLAIDEVEVVAPRAITRADARAAGFGSAAEVVADLGPDVPDRQLYRVRFRRAGEDPRVALREDDHLSAEELGVIAGKLARMDRGTGGAWTRPTLELIDELPAVAARLLAERLGQERLDLKARIRRLKALGLTESLEVGYRLSPRGRVVLAHLRSLGPPG